MEKIEKIDKPDRPDRVALFVDGANFFYMQRKDLGVLLDPKKLINYCARFGEVVDAYYYVGQDVPPEARQQSFLDALPYMGYALVTKQLKTISDDTTGVAIKKANLDVEIVLDMFNTIDNYDMAVLVSGDGDFERPLQLLKSRGKKFKVMSTDKFIAGELRRITGMHYIDFKNIVDQLRKD
ncbi:MAG: NYN domain-containing protein [Defluviitaleaceae bacterium]|nr:NYN domain-containing protein [Defluviitaleaceae bacterium]